MRYHRNLQDVVALTDGFLALAGVFERRPAVKHVDELKIAFVDVPLLNLVRVLAAVGADHMGDVVAVSGVFGAQVAVIEDVAQSRFPRCVGGDMMDEIPSFARAHNNPTRSL